MAANPKRRPGSDLGRATVDWEAAFAFYAALADECRCYQAVADEFDVSLRTVENHGRADRWGSGCARSRRRPPRRRTRCSGRHGSSRSARRSG